LLKQALRRQKKVARFILQRRIRFPCNTTSSTSKFYTFLEVVFLLKHYKKEYSLFKNETQKNIETKEQLLIYHCPPLGNVEEGDWEIGQIERATFFDALQVSYFCNYSKATSPLG
jgi:hypothetical protein